jgi:hypothetical protein
MASNKYTQQPPISGASIRSVIAERCYVAAVNTAYADPGAKLDGADPAGWTDLGIVANSKVQMTYNKDIKYIETGIDKVTRGAYTMGKTAEAQFTLEQFDLDTLELITGLTADAVGGIGGKLHIGQDDIIEKALLFVGTNKVDGKEYHTYCKKASLVYSFQDQDDARVLQVTARLYAFTPSGETVDAFFTMYVLD